MPAKKPNIERMQRDNVMAMLENYTEPSKMSKQQALEFYGSISTEIEMRVECLKEEIANEES